jgi:hypothetical protein
MIRKYIDRLLNEWITYSKIIIAVDFDDTISPWRLNSEEDIKQTNIVRLLQQAKHVGAYITIFTACSEDRYAEITQRCDSLGIKIDSINKNPIELPYGNNNKIYANIFLDDRAGLNEAMEILHTTLYEYSGYLQNHKHLDEIG